MNVPGLLYQQIMSQLGYLGHAPRDPRDRPRHVHESLAQLQPHEAEAVETMETMSRGRGQPPATSPQPQDLSLRYAPPPLHYAPAPYPPPPHIKRELSSPAPCPAPAPIVKTEPPEDPGYRLQELGHYPAPAELARSFSLPAPRPEQEAAASSGAGRQVSVDRSQGAGGCQKGGKGAEEISTSRTIIGDHLPSLHLSCPVPAKYICTELNHMTCSHADNS